MLVTIIEGIFSHEPVAFGHSAASFVLCVLHELVGNAQPPIGRCYSHITLSSDYCCGGIDSHLLALHAFPMLSMRTIRYMLVHVSRYCLGLVRWLELSILALEDS